MKRNNLFIGLCLILALLVCGGCYKKKGENDPKYSLHGRTSRLTGVWKLVEMRSIQNYSTGTLSNHAEYIFDGATMTQCFNGTMFTSPLILDTTFINYYPYSEYLTIERNGNYTREVNENNILTTTSDKWEWSDDDKTVVDFYSGTTVIDRQNIDRLSKNDLVFIEKYSKHNSGNSSSADEVYVYEKQ